MQFRVEDLHQKSPSCHVCPGRPRMHRHGFYFRKKRSEWSQRFLCNFCGSTCSVLPSGTLPYLELSIAQVHRCLNRFSQDQPWKDFTSAERRVIHAFTQNSAHLRNVLGQMVSLRATSAQRLWAEINGLSTGVEALTPLLSPIQTSLLKSYCCLNPTWSRRRKSSSAGFSLTKDANLSVPHNFLSLLGQ